jgi:hypothetical protein
MGDPPPQPFECTKGPPTVVRFEFGSQYGLLVAEFGWTGTNVTVEIQVPASTATATSTPAQLPGTGSGPTGGGALYWRLLAVALLIAGGAGSLMLMEANRES